MVIFQFLKCLVILSFCSAVPTPNSTTDMKQYDCRFDDRLVANEILRLESKSLDRSAVKTASIFRWKDHKNRVPYFFDKAVGDIVIERVKEAMEMISEKTCIKFKEVDEKNAPAHHLEIFHDNLPSDCDRYRNSGKAGPCQSDPAARCKTGNMMMSFSRHFCTSHSIRDINLVLHELGHVLGLAHTHRRPDSDQFINIHRDCIKKGHGFNFDRFNAGEVKTCKVPYKCNSMMHYSSST